MHLLQVALVLDYIFNFILQRLAYEIINELEDIVFINFGGEGRHVLPSTPRFIFCFLWRGSLTSSSTTPFLVGDKTELLTPTSCFSFNVSLINTEGSTIESLKTSWFESLGLRGLFWLVWVATRGKGIFSCRRVKVPSLFCTIGKRFSFNSCQKRERYFGFVRMRWAI